MNTLKTTVGFAVLAILLPLIVRTLRNTNDFIDDFLDPE